MLRRKIHLLFSKAKVSILNSLLFGIFPILLHAQVTPSEGSILNYRIIGFSFPANKEATDYTVELANGNFVKETDFTGHVDQKISAREHKVIAEVPSFGSDYTWRIVYEHNKSVIARSILHHFSTGILTQNGGNATRLKTKVSGQKPMDAYILSDASNTMYDMSGAPVWFLPNIDSLRLGMNNDVKVSPSGTITFITGVDAYDISYGGTILWSTKNSHNFSSPHASNFSCHHEFSKLRNGHYMSLIAEMATEQPAKEGDRKRFFPSASNSKLAEFDRNGKIVWSWESSKYLQQSDLHLLQEQYPTAPVDLHENAFWNDEDDSILYIGMSGVNRIVKIQYPSGKVLGEYGSIFPSSPSISPDTSEQAPFKVRQFFHNGVFCHQHSLKRSDDGFLYVFNNNLVQGANAEIINNMGPQVIKMRESGDTLEKVWDFDCKDVVGDEHPAHGGGGNVVLLPDNSLFVSMSAPYGDVFIIDPDRKVLWSGVTEIFQPDKGAWVQTSRYRVSIVTRAQLEQMIWNDL